MRALSIHQPYASFIIENIKFHETRSWRPHKNMIGETFAIHASKTTRTMHMLRNFVKENDPTDNATRLLCKTALEFLDNDIDNTISYGAIIGTARINYVIDCMGASAHRISILEKSLGNWSQGNYAWHLADVCAIDPIQWKGQQGWFHVPDELIAEAQQS